MTKLNHPACDDKSENEKKIKICYQMLNLATKKWVIEGIK
jgi:hypothetical protein